MSTLELLKRMEIIISHPDSDPIYLPWDVRTIIDCQFTIDDIDTLQMGVALRVGEIIMTLLPERM